MAKFSCSQGKFSGKGNVEIFYQQWAADRPKVNVVIVHGLGEHSGRYSNIIEACEGKGVSFFALDHRGHGRSNGERGHTNSFMDYIIDLKLFVNTIRRNHPDTPLLMLGHGLGGTIACKFALTYQNDLSGIILSSPGFMPTIDVPILKTRCADLLSALTPSFSISYGIDPAELSHDEVSIAGFAEDPLIHTTITPRFYTEYMEGASFCLDHARQLRIPLLIIHGEEDRFCDPKGSQLFFNRAESEDKRISILPGLFHETMNETIKPRTKVLSLLSKWIIAHSHVKSVRHTAPSPEKKKTAEKKTKSSLKGKTRIAKKA